VIDESPDPRPPQPPRPQPLPGDPGGNPPPTRSWMVLADAPKPRPGPDGPPDPIILPGDPGPNPPPDRETLGTAPRRLWNGHQAPLT
jgi:hypothetical protein